MGVEVSRDIYDRTCLRIQSLGLTDRISIIHATRSHNDLSRPMWSTLYLMTNTNQSPETANGAVFSSRFGESSRMIMVFPAKAIMRRRDESGRAVRTRSSFTSSSRFADKCPEPLLASFLSFSLHLVLKT